VKRFWTGDLYCFSLSRKVASSLDEGRTPWISSGECQIGLTKIQRIFQFLSMCILYQNSIFVNWML
jgi:hypothetical protein